MATLVLTLLGPGEKQPRSRVGQVSEAACDPRPLQLTVLWFQAIQSPKQADTNT